MKMSNEIRKGVDVTMSARKRWLQWLTVLGLGAVGLGYLLLAEHPPYSPEFSIEWDEEVQVANKQTMWVHHAEVYRRRTSLSRWDALKVTESLSFSLSSQRGFDYRLPRGGFRGIQKNGNTWVLGYAEDIHYPSIGSCVPGEGAECYVVVGSDGTTYKPKNRNEIMGGFGVLLSCRTLISDCYSQLNGKRISLADKQTYFRANPRLGDGNDSTPGQRLQEQAMQ
jgi:hypothetical protein